MFTSRSFAQKFNRDTPPSGKNPWQVTPWRVLFWVIFVSGVGMVLAVTVLWLSTFWKVSSVSVEGSIFHSSEEILETVGIQEGNLMLGFDAGDIADIIRDEYPILQSVKVRRHLNGRVVLQVKEETHLYYTCHHMNYYLIDGDNMKVLDISSVGDLYAAYGAVYIGFPEEVSLQVGKKISYAFLPYRPVDRPVELSTYEIETGTPKEEYAYVQELVEMLEDSSFAPQLVGIDASDRYDVYFVFHGNIKVRLGNMEHLERKLQQAVYLVTNELSGEGVNTVVDVSNPAKSTLRESPEITLPWWCNP